MSKKKQEEASAPRAGRGKRVVTPITKPPAMRGRKPKANPDTDTGNPVDAHVGSRVRERRLELAMSQAKLAEAVGLTFQQVQKYERGANRIGASRLYEFSTILSVPIAYFYDGLSEQAQAFVRKSQDPGPLIATDTALGRETMRMVKSYYRITRPDVRRRLYELVKSVSLDRQ